MSAAVTVDLSDFSPDNKMLKGIRTLKKQGYLPGNLSY
jgi:hypothetical protein